MIFAPPRGHVRPIVQLYPPAPLDPALDLNFAARGTLGPLVTFTRGSSATYINAAGLVATAATNAPRFAHDPVTLAPLGLLIEEARTNLVLRSEDLGDAAWIRGVDLAYAGGVASPSGGSIGLFTASGVGNGVYQSAAVTAGASYVFSFWARLGTLSAGAFRVAIYNNTAGSFIASDASVGTVLPGWSRFSVAFTAPVGCSSVRVYPFRNSGSVAGTFALWGIQLEAGAFASSYIPTTAAAATRAADVASITGAAFTGWFNQAEGTVVATFTGRTSFAGPLGLQPSSAALMGINSGSGLVSDMWGAAVARSGPDARATVVTGARAYRFADNSAAIAVAGAVTTQTPPLSAFAATGLSIGLRGNGFFPLNGTIARLRYYRRRLPDATLQALTA